MRKKLVLGASLALLFASCNTLQKVSKTAKDVKEIGETIYDFKPNRKPIDRENPKDLKKLDKYDKKHRNIANIPWYYIGRIEYTIKGWRTHYYDVYTYHVLYDYNSENFYLYDVKKSKLKISNDLKTDFKIKTNKHVDVIKAVYVGNVLNDSLAEWESYEYIFKRQLD